MAKKEEATIEVEVQEPPAMDAGAYYTLELAQLIPTPDNPRRIDKKSAGFLELVESIKRVGVLQPVLCRPYPGHDMDGVHVDGVFDLRAGARRLLAAKVAGLKTIPAIVRSMTDQEALEVTVLENLQREDLTPMEESVGCRKLLEGGWDVASIAAKLGKSETWVRRRAQLTKLSDRWLQETQDPDSPFSTWSAAHLEYISSLSAETQDELLQKFNLPDPNDPNDGWPEWDDWDMKEIINEPLSEIRRDVAAMTMELKSAPWKLDDDGLVPDAPVCSVCDSRTSQQPHLPGLFEDSDINKLYSKKVDRDADRCLNSACFKRKMQAVFDRDLAAARAKHPDIAIVQDGYWNTMNGETPPVKADCREYDVDRCKKSDPGAKKFIPIKCQNGAYSIGQAYWAKPRNDRTERATRPVDPKTGKPKPASVKEKRAKLELKRGAWIVDKVRNEELEKCARPEHLGLLEVAKYISVFGTSDHATYVGSWPIEYDGGKSSRKPDVEQTTCWTSSVEYTDPEAANKLWNQLLQVWDGRMNRGGAPLTNSNLPLHILEARHVCEVVGLDWADYERQAAEAIPEPKSWAAQEKPKKNKKKKSAADVADPADKKTKKPAKKKAAKAEKKPETPLEKARASLNAKRDAAANALTKSSKKPKAKAVKRKKKKASKKPKAEKTPQGGRCRVCGCMEGDINEGCMNPETRVGCHWIEPDLCSACETRKDDPPDRSCVFCRCAISESEAEMFGDKCTSCWEAEA